MAPSAGVDLPSSRNPPFPQAVPDSNHLTSPLMKGSTAFTTKDSNHNDGFSDIISQINLPNIL